MALLNLLEQFLPENVTPLGRPEAAKVVAADGKRRVVKP